MQVREYAEQLLFGTELADKLVRPGPIRDDAPGAAIRAPLQPGRSDVLRFAPKAARRRFPTDDALADESARGEALHAFANHELLAIELMALCLLRFPDADPAFRHDLVRSIVEEQKHLRMYITRMRDFGVTFGDHPTNGWFWSCLRQLEDPTTYLAAMSLTFEQANLDYSLHYAGVMEGHGDAKTASLLRAVYADEIGHVAIGARWWQAWHNQPVGFDAWCDELPHPLTPARARGPLFDQEGRQRAGLPADFIAEVGAFVGTKGRVPTAWQADLAIEATLRGESLTKAASDIVHDLSPLVGLLGREGDLVSPHTPASPGHRAALARAGLPRLGRGVREGHQAPRAASWSPHLDGTLSREGRKLHRKDAQVQLRSQLADHPMAEAWFGPHGLDGSVVRDLEGLEQVLETYRARDVGAAWLKAIWGSSGQGNRRCDLDQVLGRTRTWAQRCLDRDGALVVEPHFERVLDLSVPLHLGAQRTDQTVLTSLVSRGGRPSGHLLGKAHARWTPELRRAWNAGPSGLRHGIQWASSVVIQCLRDAQLDGPCGIDMFVYRASDGTLKVRPLVELNVRYTMGHVASVLQRHMAPSTVGLWLHTPRSKIHAAMQDGWTPQPPVLEERRVVAGQVFTTDPTTARRVVTLWCVGASWDDMTGRLPPVLRELASGAVLPV